MELVVRFKSLAGRRLLAFLVERLCERQLRFIGEEQRSNLI